LSVYFLLKSLGGVKNLWTENIVNIELVMEGRVADNLASEQGKNVKGNCCGAPGLEMVDKSAEIDTGCGCNSAARPGSLAGLEGNLRVLPMAPTGTTDDEPCCGPPPGPPSSPYERAGFTMCRYVDGFVDTPVGPVPRVASRLHVVDRLGTFRARIGFQRDRYRVAPGLYCVGNPGPEAVVLVTANYKLSFDSLRRELASLDAWILVIDTRGINVWCAAGKKNFSTEEVIRRVKLSGLDKVVSHCQLILPQLAGPGVAAREVKKGCGFKVQWGPVRSADLQDFLRDGKKASSTMRQVTFTLAERLVLIPVEIYLILRPSLYVLLAIFLLSGIGPEVFSIHAAWARGLVGAAAYGAAIFAGAMAVPVLLPWLPGRRFFLKGIYTGLAAGAAVLSWTGIVSAGEAVAVLLLSVAVSSYAAMNFTGATPYTSPTGVEKEMRQGIPVQAGSMLGAVIAWLAAPFLSL
jgi:hypothetical protein